MFLTYIYSTILHSPSFLTARIISSFLLSFLSLFLSFLSSFLIRFLDFFLQLFSHPTFLLLYSFPVSLSCRFFCTFTPVLFSSFPLVLHLAFLLLFFLSLPLYADYLTQSVRCDVSKGYYKNI
jgi:hypothetical protein